MVSSKNSGLALKTEHEGRARLENDAATKQLNLVMETGKERKAKLEKWSLPHWSC